MYILSSGGRIQTEESQKGRDCSGICSYGSRILVKPRQTDPSFNCANCERGMLSQKSVYREASSNRFTVLLLWRACAAWVTELGL